MLFISIKHFFVDVDIFRIQQYGMLSILKMRYLRKEVSTNGDEILHVGVFDRYYCEESFKLIFLLVLVSFGDLKGLCNQLI